MELIINPNPSSWQDLLKRPSHNTQDLEATVKQVFNDVNDKGDKAIKKYTKLFDGADLKDLKLEQTAIEEAEASISDDLKQAIQLAKSNIEAFHIAQKTNRVAVETTPGVQCWQEKKPIEHVGLYIPGGTAPLFSTILMLAIPAQLAGCKHVSLCTPPDKNGDIKPEIIYAAQLCGVGTIYKVGGIQAIAGLTFGTETIVKVSKIFGPGNQYVTAAKQWATKHGVAIDMPAGPSELLVYADESADASFVASDLLSQAEHGEDSQVILVASNKSIANSVLTEVKSQLNQLSRKAIATKALSHSKCIVLSSKTEALSLINDYAPEHLIICSEDETFFIEGITNAGSVFIGNFTPESAGDYASGTNHTLPTNGYAKAYSGVNLDSFLKSITYQKINKAGIKAIGPSIELMAQAEGLDAHKNAVSIRLQKIS